MKVHLAGTLGIYAVGVEDRDKALVAKLPRSEGLVPAELILQGEPVPFSRNDLIRRIVIATTCIRARGLASWSPRACSVLPDTFRSIAHL
jgi:hypothetical protein